MKLFKKITFVMMLLSATTSLQVSAQTDEEEEESYNIGILLNDELPNVRYDFGASVDAVASGGGRGIIASAGFDDQTNDIPIDGGISILVGAGLAYGAARLRKKKENKDLFI
jgi:hypothetical protein